MGYPGADLRTGPFPFDRRLVRQPVPGIRHQRGEADEGVTAIYRRLRWNDKLIAMMATQMRTTSNVPEPWVSDSTTPVIGNARANDPNASLIAELRQRSASVRVPDCPPAAT